VHLSTLFDWLNWIGSVHSTEIDLGLDRIGVVAEKLGVLKPDCPVITVGGTNGKGSVVAGLDAIYRAAGYRVGTFTSPYLLVHNEEVRLQGVEADDAQFIRAFEKIESARADVSLTPFEYHTLAALLIFVETKLDVMILEVGLGGRLDAVNVVDADAAVVTSIGIDHVAWLGDTREKIAIEKAGIFRFGKPAISGDADSPATLIAAARNIGATYYQQGESFQYTEFPDHWSWRTLGTDYENLPRNHLLTQNMATVLMTITCLQKMLPVTEAAIHLGLQDVRLSGRMQCLPGPVTEILDVAHNPAAAEVLANRLHQLPCAGKTWAVFSMLEDKDILNTLALMRPEVSEWVIAPLDCKRAAPLATLKKIFRKADISSVRECESITAAYQVAKTNAAAGDRIIIFGSFYVVAAIMRLKQLAP